MADVPRPPTITIAFWIALIVPLLATLLIGIQMALSRSEVESAAVGPDAEMVRLVGGGLMVAAILVYLVLSGLWILFGFKLRAGRNWARVTLTVFAAFWGLQSIGSLISGAIIGPNEGAPGGAVLALSYTEAGLSLVSLLAFLVLVYLTPSNRYFQATRHRL